MAKRTTKKSRTTFTFQGTQHATLEAMLDAIATAWATGNGTYPPALGAPEPTLAHECMDGLGLDLFQGEGQPVHMDENGYTFHDLVEAFARLRARTARRVAS